MNRPTGFINYEKAINIIENSISSAMHWEKTTNDAFNSSERIFDLENLLNIVVELYWRYGNNVWFCFTTKKHIDKTIPICEIIPEIPEPWNHRIFVNESDIKIPRVYIKF